MLKCKFHKDSKRLPAFQFRHILLVLSHYFLFFFFRNDNLIIDHVSKE